MRTITFALLAACAGPAAIQPDIAKIHDATIWRLINVESQVDNSGVHLSPIGGNHQGSNVGMALVAGMTFAAGTIDVDVRGPGEERASFLGVAFGVMDQSTYEAIYFRPFRFRATDPVDRSHAVQYVAWPEHTWEQLRAQSPGVYESAIAPVPDPADWFHARIVVAADTVKVFVDGATQPTLVVHRLRSASGGVGLWVDSQDGAFAHLAISQLRSG